MAATRAASTKVHNAYSPRRIGHWNQWMQRTSTCTLYIRHTNGLSDTIADNRPFPIYNPTNRVADGSREYYLEDFAIEKSPLPQLCEYTSRGLEDGHSTEKGKP
jgi:hypothetical protein